MSSQIASVATEPARASTERQSRTGSGQVRGAGTQQLTGLTDAPAKEAPEPVKIETPELEAAVENLQKLVSRRQLEFSIDQDSGRTIITVIESDSGEVIRQIPPNEVLRIARSVVEGDFHLIDGRA